MSAGGLLEKPQIIAHTQHSLNYTVFDCKWVPCSARLLCLGNFPRGTGVIQLYELQGGRLILLREVRKRTKHRAAAPVLPQEQQEAHGYQPHSKQHILANHGVNFASLPGPRNTFLGLSGSSSVDSLRFFPRLIY